MPHRRADWIASTLEDRIVIGHYADGARLDEARLADEFGTSRTPVREALHRVATSGLAEQVAHKGVFVRQPSARELCEMFEVMAEIEGVCARLAAERRTAQDLEDLAAANATCRAARYGDDAELAFEKNLVFHNQIYRLARNTFLEHRALTLQKRLQAYRRAQLSVQGRPEQAMAEHDAVVAAIAEQDGETAARRLRAHVSVQRETFTLLLQHQRQAAE